MKIQRDDNLSHIVNWMDDLIKIIEEGKWASVDFWNTLVIEQIPRINLRKLVCNQLIQEFDLKLDEENLYDNFLRVSNGLISISEDFEKDQEYKLSSVWFYVGVNYFSSNELALIFSKRAIEIEIFQSFLNSTVFAKTREQFNSIAASENLVVISDFEGDSNFLRQVARLHGLELPKKILVSSEHLINKRSSRLYRLCPELGPNSFHFGDNYEADIIGAELAGIRSIKVPSSPQKSKFHKKNPVLPHPLPAFRKDQQAASKLVAYFTDELRKSVRDGDAVFFLGSEGAFLSNAMKISEDNITYACFNGGRQLVILGCLELHTSWVISKYLQENVNLSIILKIIGVDTNDKYARILAFNSIVEANQNVGKLLSPTQIEKSRLTKFQISQAFAISEIAHRIILVDIGYRGTFAQGMKRLFGDFFSVIQVFGIDYELNQNNIENVTLFKESDGIDFRSSIPMIELIFGAGPRASHSERELKNFQENVWSNAIRINTKHVQRETTRLLHWPSRKLIQILRNSISIDDFSSSRNPFFGVEKSPRKKYANSKFAHYRFGLIGVISLYLAKRFKFLMSK